MSQEKNVTVAKELLSRLAKATPEEVGELFAEDLSWEIPGDVGALPWLGHHKGRQAAVAFARDSRELIERIRFDVKRVLADTEQAVILGELASKVKRTGKVVENTFAIILTVEGGLIARFQMLEDSLGTSRAAR